MVMFLVFSGMPNADDDHIRGVGILVNRNIRGALLEWNPVSKRIITARIQYQKGSSQLQSSIRKDHHSYNPVSERIITATIQYQKGSSQLESKLS